MKKLLLAILLFHISTFVTFAQSVDTNGISVSAYVAPNSGVPPAATKVLETKLRNLISSSGMITAENQRFILTAHVVTLSEDVTATAPPQYAYTLGINLYYGDGMTGNLFASANFETKGVGTSKDKAYLMALRALKPTDPSLKAMLAEGKQKSIDYFLSQGPTILNEAQMCANNQDYEQAIYILDQIPSACTDLYAKANEMKINFYNKFLAEEGATALAQARSIWNAGQDRESADRAGAILASINPQSPAYKEAQTFANQIAARIKALDDREWQFKLQQQADETAVRKQSISAAREIAVAKAKNQPKTVYKVYWW